MYRAATPESGVRRAPVWVPVAAWGYGLVSVALGAAAIVGVQADVMSRLLGVIAVAVGLGSLAWGGTCLALGRMVLGRTVTAGVLAGVGVAVALLGTPPGRASILAVALLLGLGVAVACGVVHARRRPSPGGGSWGLVLAAAAVTLVVVPALHVCQGAALLDADGTVAPVVTHDGH